ncbi:MAG: NAD(P)/FAD-dependent oxidoreductase [Parvularculaceae bacterium]
MAGATSTYDVIVIGAGHNGLAAAATLAKKGKRVCVLERSAQIGGMSSSYVIADGVAFSRLAHLAHNLNPTVANELGVSGKLSLTPLLTVMLSPDGKHVVIDGASARYADGSAHPHAAEYEAIRARIEKFAALLAPLALRSPPDLTQGLKLSGAGEALPLAALALKLKLMGKKDMRDFLRIVLSNIYDLTMDEMPDGPLAGNLAADAVWGAWIGPRSPSTVFSLMYRYGAGGKAMLPKGGMGAITDAFAAAAKDAGAEIRTGVGVKRVLVEGDAVRGVETADGAKISAHAVMSSAGAFQSMMMAGVEHYDVEAVRRVRHVRSKGMTAKVNILLKGAPSISGLSVEQMKSRLVIAPTALYVERAFTEAKYGAMASAPIIEAVIPTLTHGGSTHAVSAVVHYIPYHLKGGWNDAARDRLTALTLDTLGAYWPGLRDNVQRVDTLSPADIERETGAPGGHWHHAELTIDQLLTVRPVNQMSRYAYGVKGFYLCGASAHPGGDVSGAAGRNSALQLLKDGVIA